MAREKLSNAITELHGATSPRQIHRVKRFRDARGRIIGSGVQEMYEVTHPRDFTKKPPRGAELANQQLFSLANQIANRQLETDEGYVAWQKRFEAQLYVTRGGKADPFAPYDPHKGAKKRYKRFDAFVRTMIMQELKAKQKEHQID
ncbi:MAG: hypothetical protein J5761_03075 [Paludibacteraceae bacterium]|nr:hypothetical protein [Paludibacteraceae bacterium]